MKDKTDFDTLEDTASNHLNRQVMHVFYGYFTRVKKEIGK